MDLKLVNLCCFRDFHVNFSYPRKVENEYLEGFPNFRYKKINIIMGSNATGKTSLGRVILSIFNFIDKRNADIITRFISNKNKKNKIYHQSKNSLAYGRARLRGT